MLKWPTQPPDAPGPRGTVPVWADPAWVSAGTAVRAYSYVLVSGELQILVPNPTRISFVVCGSHNTEANLKISPQPDVVNTGLDAPADWRDAVFTIFNLGPLVQGSWWVSGIDTTSVVVYEVYRL